MSAVIVLSSFWEEIFPLATQTDHLKASCIDVGLSQGGIRSDLFPEAFVNHFTESFHHKLLRLAGSFSLKFLFIKKVKSSRKIRGNFVLY